MIKLCIFIILCSLVGLVFIIYIMNAFSLRKQTAIDNLDLYIMPNIENRKLTTKNLKNTYKNNILSEIYRKGEYVYYKKLSRCNIASKMNKLSILKTPTIYTEYKTKQHLKLLIPLSQKTQTQINKSKTTYRARGEKCIIENVAFSLANGVLVKDKFDIFEEFKELCSLSKVYKKEAKILNTLVISELLQIYLSLAKDVDNVRNKILKARTIKKIRKNSNLSCQTIYGIYLLNKQGTKLIKNHQLNVQEATTTLLCELDQILMKQRIIYNYLKVLSGA